MAFFTRASLEELKSRIDLVEVISSHATLSKHGASYKGLCPFHDEKTPSFTVQSGDSHYHCFGCGAHGDAIQFLMDHLKVSFSEAVEILAEQFHVSLEREAKADPAARQRGQIKDLLATTHRFFQMMLLHTQEGKQALEYLYNRGIPLSFIEKFGLGYAPSASHGFIEFMKDRGFSLENLRDAGLLSQSNRPLFIERITFPIHHVSGYVVGFSARKFLPGSYGGKYVNSPETLLFKKSSLLFGLNFSRRVIAKERQALLVEGQLDALRLIDAGLSITCACQGTAFTEKQAQLLSQLGVETVYIAFDSDLAGQEAACKVGDIFQKQGVDVRILLLPFGEDPDSLICKQGVEAFKQMMEGAKGFIPFLVHHHSQQHPLTSPSSKDQLARKLAKQIRSWEHPVLVHESLKHLAELLQIPSSTLGIRESVAHRSIRSRPIEPQGDFQIDPDKILEMELLRWFIHGKDKQESIRLLVQSNLKPEHFKHAGCQSIADKILFATDAENDALSLAMNLETEDDQNLLDEILRHKVPTERTFEGAQSVVKRILDRNWMQHKELIKKRIHEQPNNQETIFELVKEYNELNQNPPKVLLPQT